MTRWVWWETLDQIKCPALIVSLSSLVTQCDNMSSSTSWNVSVNRPQDIWHLMSCMVWHGPWCIVSCHVWNIWTNLSFRLFPNDQIMQSLVIHHPGSSRPRQMAEVGSWLLVTTFPHHIISEPLIINLSRVTNSMPSHTVYSPALTRALPAINTGMTLNIKLLSIQFMIVKVKYMFRIKVDNKYLGS